LDEIAQIYQERRRTAEAGLHRKLFVSEERKLNEEQKIALDNCLRQPEPNASTAGGAPAPVAVQQQQPAPRYPLAYQNLASVVMPPPAGYSSAGAAGNAKTGTPAFAPETPLAVAQIQQSFVKDIGGLKQNPADPNYLKRWTSAQSVADEALRSAVGWEAYNRIGLETARKAAGTEQP
jgi:hypothetical protein